MVLTCWAALVSWLSPESWLAVVLIALVSCKQRPDRLAGDYRSTWGGCRVEVSGQQAVVFYPRGVMNCQMTPGAASDGAETVTLACGWQSGETRGRASFETRPAEPSRWTGHWGFGESDRGGGDWLLTR